MAWTILAAFLLMSAAALAWELQTITGAVTFACPQGHALKVKSTTAEVMMYVHPKCPHRADLMAQIKTLRVGKHVRCKYYTQNGKNYVTKITVLQATP
jgi:hypothetical protein